MAGGHELPRGGDAAGEGLEGRERQAWRPVRADEGHRGREKNGTRGGVSSAVVVVVMLSRKTMLLLGFVAPRLCCCCLLLVPLLVPLLLPLLLCKNTRIFFYGPPLIFFTECNAHETFLRSRLRSRFRPQAIQSGLTALVRLQQSLLRDLPVLTDPVVHTLDRINVDRHLLDQEVRQQMRMGAARLMAGRCVDVVVGWMVLSVAVAATGVSGVLSAWLVGF